MEYNQMKFSPTKHVLVKIFSEADSIPSYATRDASGMDIEAIEDKSIEPGKTVVLKTGLYVEIPPGYEIQVRPRSGISLKTPLRIANSPGTIDADYRGEIGVIMTNTGTDSITINKGDRIAQLVLCEVPKIQWVVAQSKDDLLGTSRGTGGFGSTGG